MISKIERKMIPLMWPILEPHISSAVEHSNGELTVGKLYDEIMSGILTLFTICERGELLSVVTFERRKFDSGKEALFIVTAGGKDHEKWVEDIIAEANQVAKNSNCTDIYIIGRAGWKKSISKFGFKPAHVAFTREVI